MPFLKEETVRLSEPKDNKYRDLNSFPISSCQLPELWEPSQRRSLLSRESNQDKWKRLNHAAYIGNAPQMFKETDYAQGKENY